MKTELSPAGSVQQRPPSPSHHSGEGDGRRDSEMEGGDERLPSRKRSTQNRGGKFVDGALSRPSSILSFPLFSFLLQGARLKAQSHPPQDCISAIKARNKVTKAYPTAILLMSLLHLLSIL